MSFPPVPSYPLAIDSDETLFKVFNTSEAQLTADNLPWSQELSIEPVEADEDEIWAENGFATISGELFYYDAVEKDENDKINKLKRCGRNLGGKKTQFNPSGTWVRGFVIAEHHNQLVSSILNIESFVGINFDTEIATLDYRIRHLEALPSCDDDYQCPEVTLEFEVVEESEDACTGTIVSYSLLIDGFFKNFRIDFGDGTFSTSEQTGTHTYPPNSLIDPIVRVSNDLCEVVQSAIQRTNPKEPEAQIPVTSFNIEVPESTAFPPIIVPNITTPETTLTLPQVVFPCELGIGPVGPFEFPSVIIVEPGIPSNIVFSPINIPSIITFENVPSFSPIAFGPAPSFSPIAFGPAPSFSPITFGVDVSFTTIDFGPAPTFSPISFGPSPTFSPIAFGPSPTFSPIAFGPSPTFSPIAFGPAPTFSPIAFGPAPSFSPITFGVDVSITASFSPIAFGPAPTFSPISFGPSPTFSPISFGPSPTFSPISFGPAPSFTPISFGPAPSFSPIAFGPAPPSYSPISFGPAPVVSVNWNTPTISVSFTAPSITVISFSPIGFGPAPSISVNWGTAPSVSFGPAPSISVSWGSAPTISVSWGPAPTCSCTMTVTCPSSMTASARSAFVEPNEFVDPFVNVEMDAVGIPSEINLVVPIMPDISLVHSLPQSITFEVPEIPPIKIIQDVPIPKEIRLYSDTPIPTSIVVKSEIPSVFKLDTSDLPAFQLEIPEKLPKILIDATGIPSTIQVVGIPATIELKGSLPSEIFVRPAPDLEIPMVYKGGPIPVQFDFKTPAGDAGEAPCFALVPCGK